MKTLTRFITALLLCVFAGSSVVAQGQDATKKKVAVYVTGDADNSVKKVLGAKLVTAITSSGTYAAVERTADFLEAIAQENDYQTSGEVRDSQIVRLGNKFGVRFVVVADVNEVWEEFFISSRLINVETGLVEKALDVSGPAQSLPELTKLSKEVSDGLLKEQYSSSSNFSNTPLHLSLYVTKEDGTKCFITKEQWSELKGREKYLKGGVCVVHDGKRYIIGLNDTKYSCLEWDPSLRSNAPSFEQLYLLYRYRRALNDCMHAFGGDEINGFYWAPGWDYNKPTSRNSRNSGNAWVIPSVSSLLKWGRCYDGNYSMSLR